MKAVNVVLLGALSTKLNYDGSHLAFCYRISRSR